MNFYCRGNVCQFIVYSIVRSLQTHPHAHMLAHTHTHTHTQASVLTACIAAAIPVACVCEYHAANKQQAGPPHAPLYVEESVWGSQVSLITTPWQQMHWVLSHGKHATPIWCVISTCLCSLLTPKTATSVHWYQNCSFHHIAYLSYRDFFVVVCN